MKKLSAVLISLCFITSTGFSAVRGQRNFRDNTQRQHKNANVNARPQARASVKPASAPSLRNRAGTAVIKQNPPRTRTVVNRNNRINRNAISGKKSVPARRISTNNFTRQRINNNTKKTQPQQRRRVPFLKNDPKNNTLQQRQRRTIINNANSSYHKPDPKKRHNYTHNINNRRGQNRRDPFLKDNPKTNTVQQQRQHRRIINNANSSYHKPDPKKRHNYTRNINNIREQNRRSTFLKDNPKNNTVQQQRPHRIIINSVNSSYHKPDPKKRHNYTHNINNRRGHRRIGHRTIYNPFVHRGIFGRFSAIPRRRYFYRTYPHRHYFYRKPSVNLTFYNYSDPYWTYYDSVYYANTERVVEIETAAQEISVSETADVDAITNFNAALPETADTAITVLNAAFYRVYSTAAPAEPTAEITVLNNSDYVVSEIYFSGQIETLDTGKVLIDDVFSYVLPQYLMPGQSGVYKIPLSSFENWKKVKPPDTAFFSVVVTDITTDSGEFISNP